MDYKNCTITTDIYPHTGGVFATIETSSDDFTTSVFRRESDATNAAKAEIDLLQSGLTPGDIIYINGVPFSDDIDAGWYEHRVEMRGQRYALDNEWSIRDRNRNKPAHVCK